jgi:hypothetical protein
MIGEIIPGTDNAGTADANDDGGDSTPITQEQLVAAQAAAAKAAIEQFKKQQKAEDKKKVDEAKAQEDNDYRQLYEEQQKRVAELEKQTRLAEYQAVLQRNQATYPDIMALAIPQGAEDVDREVALLKKKYPEYFKIHSSDGGAGNGAAGSGSESLAQDMNYAIRRAAGR